VKRLVALLSTVVAALVACSTAFANALSNGHSPTPSQPGQTGQFKPPGLGAHTSGAGTLPFTGLNLALIAAVAVLLLASGLLLHRMTRRQ
jgi:hypothetical protein